MNPSKFYVVYGDCQELYGIFINPDNAFDLWQEMTFNFVQDEYSANEWVTHTEELRKEYNNNLEHLTNGDVIYIRIEHPNTDFTAQAKT